MKLRSVYQPQRLLDLVMRLAIPGHYLMHSDDVELAQHNCKYAVVWSRPTLQHSDTPPLLPQDGDEQPVDAVHNQVSDRLIRFKAIEQTAGLYKLVATYSMEIEPGRSPSITCKICGSRSFSPKDIRMAYCGRCHIFHDQILPGQPLPDWHHKVLE